MQHQVKKISCSTAQMYSQLLLDGRLTPLQRLELDQHTSSCKSCEALNDALRVDSSLLTAWTPTVSDPEPTSAFNAKILAAIAAEQDQQTVKSSNGWWQIAIALVCAGVMCVGFGLLASYQSGLATFNPLDHLDTAQINLPTISWQGTWTSFTESFGNESESLRAISMTSWQIAIGFAAIAANMLFVVKVRTGRKGNKLV